MAASAPQASQASPYRLLRIARNTHNFFGFKKGYNFTLWFIFAGALFGFVLARLQYLSINDKFRQGSAPGEWYYLRKGFRRIGIILHLATILPGGLLVIFQFVPIVRSKALIFHRVNGYAVILLLLLSNVGALMITRHSFGGEFETQVLMGLLAILTTSGAAMAYYNIKRLQIDQHRAWMLRTWFYAGSIITLRIIMIISTLIITNIGGYYRAMPCKQLAFTLDDPEQFASAFPQCLNVNGTTDGRIAVSADFNGIIPQVGNSLDVTFGTAGWLALFLHAAGVEIYLALTPREGERLRVVSYERQIEAGFKHAGNSALSVDR